MSFRNRCVVAGANGSVILSIPLIQGREQRRPMHEVLIDNKKNWQVQHWRTITSCYNRSPWFDFFSEELAAIYRQPVELLVDWNRRCFEWIAGKIGVPITTGSDGETRQIEDESGYHDFRDWLLPRSIEKNFPDPVRYRQVFEDRNGFIPHLSILDLLFCEGKNAHRLLGGA